MLDSFRGGGAVTRSIAMAFALSGLLGSGCEKTPMQGTDSPKTDPTSASATDGSESHRHPDVRRVALRLGKSLQVAPLDPAQRPAAINPWAPPPCPLGYQFQADLIISVIDGPPGFEQMGDSGLRIAGQITMAAGTGDVTAIRNGEIELSHVENGVQRPGGTRDPETLAEVRLRRDGAQWQEVDGPTALWSAFGSFTGVEEFWPALPSKTEPGSATPWTLLIHKQRDAARTEATRGSLEFPAGYAFPTPNPTTIGATVELGGWLSVEGQPAMVLVSQWSHTDSFDFPEEEEARAAGFGDDQADIALTIKARARYVVLHSGRLLWADVQRTTYSTMDLGEQSMKQRHDLRAWARLSSACDGPIMSEPPVEPSLEEAALDAFAAFRNAAHEDDAAGMVRVLAPELLRAHGKDAVVALLREYVTKNTALSLGVVEMAHDVRREGNRVRVHMTGSIPQGTDSMMTVHTVVEFEARDGVLVIVRIGIDPLERDERWSVLEISETRLFLGTVE